ncbi:hypothetical protein NLU14_08715 [Marinobacter sp. 71-i]|uniref:Uncharacterized protein n=1 Tax=Marinobacter iranensis TaxID=2962607 RepID=A0ABT5Y9R7_9GAMM|nr:hypothetical protein [Marinobacter iranensis]MDF0750311.1 hypothetical protein [Marinobacter iranensis]
MSKRFGRSQKRRMRQEIERLQFERDMQRALGERNRQIVEETAQVLGRHFLTLDPNTVELQDLNQRVYGWRMIADSGALSCADFGSKLPTFETFTEIVLPILYGSVIAGDLHQHVHIRFTHAGRDVGYGITKAALKMLPSKVAIQRIAQAMAQHLQNDMEGLAHD